MDARCILALIQTDGTDDIKITKRMRWELDQPPEQPWAIHREVCLRRYLVIVSTYRYVCTAGCGCSAEQGLSKAPAAVCDIPTP